MVPLISEHAADEVEDEEGKAAFVWMLGEFCDFVENGLSTVKKYLDSFLDQENSVQMALLTAVVKLFLRDPVGMEATLHTVLDVITQQCTNADLRDRAFMYWRLLSKGIGVEKMKIIVHGRQAPMDLTNPFHESMTRNDMITSLNTAASVYGKPLPHIPSELRHSRRCYSRR